MQNLTFSRHSIVTTPEGGMRFAIAVRDHQVRTDQPEKLGGTDTAPTPLELLGASLSACIALYVRKYCAAEGLPAEDIVVEAKPVWRENPGRIGRFDVLVHLPDGIPQRYHEAINQAAQDCPVHHTLTHVPEITVELRAYEGAGI